MDDDSQMIVDQVDIEQAVPTYLLETSFREALSNVCLLGTEAFRVRTILRNLPVGLAFAFERTYYTCQWQFITHYHHLWCVELIRRNEEFIRAVITI